MASDGVDAGRDEAAIRAAILGGGVTAAEYRTIERAEHAARATAFFDPRNWRGLTGCQVTAIGRAAALEAAGRILAARAGDRYGDVPPPARPGAGIPPSARVTATTHGPGLDSGAAGHPAWE
jgi:hypothetical protein